ncbi:MAG: ATP-binding protein [Thermoanaerobaculia bacterium]|nr:ATP-binding protein [Thermoanaerobaculia bacterium]
MTDRPSPGVISRLAAGLAVAVLLLLLQGVLGRARGVDEEAWRTRVEAEYLESWSELDRVAQDAAADVAALLASMPDPEADRLSLFRRLPSLARAPATTLLILDPNRDAVAWTGEGLLHEPPGWDLPEAGHAVRLGATAITMMTVYPVDQSRRPWRVVAGRSLPSDPFPFDDLRLAHSPRWSIVETLGTEPKAADPPPGQAAVSGKPRIWHLGREIDQMLVIHVGPEPLRRSPEMSLGWSLALALTAAVTFLSAALASPRSRPLATAFLVAFGLGLPVRVLGGSAGSALALASAAALLSLRASSPRFLLPGVRRAEVSRGVVRARSLNQVWAVVGFLAYSGAVWWLQSETGAWDLASQPVWEGEEWQTSARAIPWLLATSSWILVLLLSTALPRSEDSDPPLLGSEGGRTREPDTSGWMSAATVLLAASFLDSPWLAWGLGGISAALAARWWFERSLSGLSSRGALAGLALLSALLAAVGWQSGQRWVFRDAAAEYLPLLRPPTLEELNEILVELHEHFDGLDVGPYLPPPSARSGPGGDAELEDLAFALWQNSPLPERDGLSALVVAPVPGAEPVGVRSTFAFGLALGASGPAPSSARWPMPLAEAWRDALSGGAGFLWLDGRPWGEVTYWFQVRPGFRLDADESEELQANLVRGGPRRRAADGLPEPLRYALYDFDGRALSSPWTESPPLPKPLLDRMLDQDRVLSIQVSTPEGLSKVWLRTGPDGIEALYLPRLGLRGGLEKVGNQALASLVLLLLLAVASLVSAVPRVRVRWWLDDLLRSYSKRLILVYTALLLLPLVALNLVLLQGFSERMRAEQVEGAEAAVAAARSLVVDYLSGLEPGFLFETQVNRELLEWISDLVGHQVNLYWGSRLFASSQEELFTAGLLPRRIPGEIYTRLALLGYDTGFRTQSTGSLDYLEVYAPLDVPGIASSQQGLFLSVPLLEREEEVSRDLQAMRRRAFLISAGLFALLVAVGGRLARRFTRPITELVDGTRRIARGEPLVPLRPKERELETLAEAIGVMADQVEEGRRKLLLEKQFIERVVAHIDAAVVSLDRQGRVLVFNRVAEELLGVAAGDRLDEILAEQPALAPVGRFLDSARRRGRAAEAAAKIRPKGDKVEIHEWALTWIPLPGEEDPVELLVVDDATEVLRSQRLEAWVEMARIIAHEIKNPLTPIRLSTEHLQQVWRQKPERFGDVLDKCAANIIRNVDELREIASEFSIYSRIPVAALESEDLAAMLRTLADSYRYASERGVELVVRLPDAETRAPADRKLLSRAVRNLLENALRAVTASDEGERRLELSLRRVGAEMEIEVADSGPGVDPQKLDRIFEPYFSTHETGTGLGLAITRRIVEQHSGSVVAQNRPEGGLSVVITLPTRPPGSLSEVR